jgi:uncharacterized protein YbjT (DUF2867 family)
MFATNSLFWWAGQIRAGDTVRWPYANVETAPIDQRDIAAVAVKALTEEGHTGAEYVVTGPESLTHAEQVAIIGRAVGRTLRYQEVPVEDARVEFGLPEYLFSAWAAALGHPAFITSAVEELTGRPARTFAVWAADHKHEFLP